MSARSSVAWTAERIGTIALATFREAVRNKVLYVLVLFAVALMGFSLVLGSLSLHEEVRVIRDMGLSGISLSGVAIALFLGVNLLSKELDRKTVYAILPKPIHRFEFLLGKYLGLAATIVTLVAVMVALLAGFLLIQGGSHGAVMLRAEILIVEELLLVVAVAILFSSFSSPYLSAMFTFALWVIGRNTAELEGLATGKLAGTPLGLLLGVVAELVPDFRMFFVSGASLGDGTTVSVHDAFVDWAYVADATLYGACYGGVCLALAMVLFSRRDLV
jgi:ABC-type transport system involved in multi-copper enzyme maturation permease subunit